MLQQFILNVLPLLVSIVREHNYFSHLIDPYIFNENHIFFQKENLLKSFVFNS
jgi:hypothetical protein